MKAVTADSDEPGDGALRAAQVAQTQAAQMAQTAQQVAMATQGAAKKNKGKVHQEWLGSPLRFIIERVEVVQQ